MLIKDMNLVFLVGIILCLELNPFLSMNALTKEKHQITTLNEKIIKKNSHDKKNSYSSLFSEVKEFRTAQFFLKSSIQYEKRSQSKNFTIVGELLLGSIGSIGFGIAGASIGTGLSNDEGWFADLGEAIIGYLIGSTLGSSLGVYIIGASGDEKGSFGSTLGGSILGTAVGIGLLYITADNNAIIGFISYTLAQSAGATIAFNASARKKNSDSAMLHLREGKWSFSFPKIHLTTHPLHPDKLLKTVSIVSMEF